MSDIFDDIDGVDNSPAAAAALAAAAAFAAAPAAPAAAPDANLDAANAAADLARPPLDAVAEFAAAAGFADAEFAAALAAVSGPAMDAGDGSSDEPEAAAVTTRGIVTRCLADVAAEQVAWLWPGRFALGKLSLIGGVPGVGKSWLSMFIASAISRAMPWPDGRGNAPLGSVLIANAEDGVADTIKPRLLAMGADCQRIHVIDCVKHPGEKGMVIERGFTLADVAHLQDEILRRMNCKVVIVDPVSAHLADADEHRNGEVRAMLKPLSKMAEKCGVAIILITHLTKNGGPNSVHRMIGSIAFAGAARSVWMVAKDPSSPSRRLLLMAKCNIAPDEGGLAYSIVDGALAFEPEPVTESADDILLAQQNAGDDFKPGPEPVATNAAMDWLGKLLDGGELPASTVKSEASAAGLAWRTVQRASEAMGIIKEKNRFNGGWQWRFPKPGSEGAKSGGRE